MVFHYIKGEIHLQPEPTACKTSEWASALCLQSGKKGEPITKPHQLLPRRKADRKMYQAMKATQANWPASQDLSVHKHTLWPASEKFSWCLGKHTVSPQPVKPSTGRRLQQTMLTTTHSRPPARYLPPCFKSVDQCSHWNCSWQTCTSALTLYSFLFRLSKMRDGIRGIESWRSLPKGHTAGC